MVGPAERRAVFASAQESFRLSERRACRVLRVCRSSMRYFSVRPNQEPLRSRIREIAAVRVSYGYRRVHVLLRREGWPINRKRVHRLYREEGLCLRPKRPKRHRMAVARQVRPAATEPNQRWAMDFMSDALHNGRRLRVLTVVDACTRECVALEARGMFRSEDVAAALTRVGLERGLPAAISVDDGTEFTARAMDHWAYTHRVELDYSRPGKPTDNAFIEAFNSLVRRECLSQHYFWTLEEARHVLETWREEYSNHRPHGSLGDRTPAEYKTGGHYVPDRTSAPQLARLMDQGRGSEQ